MLKNMLIIFGSLILIVVFAMLWEKLVDWLLERLFRW